MRLHVIEKVDLQLEVVTSAERIETDSLIDQDLQTRPAICALRVLGYSNSKPSRPLRANEGFGEYRLKTKDS